MTFGLAFVTFGLGGFLTFAFLAGLVFVFFGGGEMSMVYWKVWLSPRSIPIGLEHGEAIKPLKVQKGADCIQARPDGQPCPCYGPHAF